MEFKEVLYRAKEMDDTATLQIMEMFRPLLLKYAKVNNQVDEDLYEENDCSLILCIKKFPYC